ncbi:MAG TPA: NAD(P)H-dependent oxidoreductase [Candidatus Paceibacterota bacterium]|jgi:multimeric flavodoxin WrbA|nr:NAD(P)H-dependent oxidoreductase [Candidatus Paceibacterota bacterium]
MNPQPLNVLVLNASLKHGPEISNTEEVTNKVLEHMQKSAPITATTVRLADKNIPVGLVYKVDDADEWPGIVAEIQKADIIIFATPIWWGGRSSLMQRVIERMDAFDEGTVPGGRNSLLNKVAGIVITGSEDGAQAVMASIMEVLSFLNFTLPPQCCTYWVGEVGMDTKTDADRRRANPAVDHMAEATARNLVYYASLLKEHPQQITQ